MQNNITKSHRQHVLLDALQWSITGLAIICAVVLSWLGFAEASFAAIILTFPFAIVQAVRRYGWRLFLLFFGITYIISNFFENLSIITGFPFGQYHYTDHPQLLHVPVFIGIIYFGLGYISWITAITLLDRADERLNLKERIGRFNVILLPMLAGAIMAIFDMGRDSQASTIHQAWIWEKGGGLFGVPLTNYLGWWLVTYIYFQVFALLLARAQTRNVALAKVRSISLLQPVLIYIALAMSSIGTFITSKNGVVIDSAGISWNIHAINESMLIINIFSGVTIGLLACAKIARGDTKTPR